MKQYVQKTYNTNIMNRAQSREMHYKTIYLWEIDRGSCKNLN